MTWIAWVRNGWLRHDGTVIGLAAFGIAMFAILVCMLYALCRSQRNKGHGGRP